MAPGGAWGLVGCLLGDDDQIICGKYNVVLENVRYCQEQIQSLGAGGSNHLWSIIRC